MQNKTTYGVVNQRYDNHAPSVLNGRRRTLLEKWRGRGGGAGRWRDDAARDDETRDDETRDADVHENAARDVGGGAFPPGDGGGGGDRGAPACLRNF